MYFDDDEIPNQETTDRIADITSALLSKQEEREHEMFTLKEEICKLVELLGVDMDATSLSFALDGDMPVISLKPTDVKVLQDTIDELKSTLNARKLESLNMIDKENLQATINRK